MSEQELFGRWVKRRRNRLDLTQRALAAQVGCAAITIRKIEADQLRPSRQVALRLSDALELQPAERTAFAAAARGEHIDHAPLPPLLTPLVGREEATAQVFNRLLRDDVRLLTLIGPPGIGKTSLALQVAALLQPHFSDGAVWVALADIRAPELSGRVHRRGVGAPRVRRPPDTATSSRDAARQAAAGRARQLRAGPECCGRAGVAAGRGCAGKATGHQPCRATDQRRARAAGAAACAARYRRAACSSRSRPVGGGPAICTACRGGRPELSADCRQCRGCCRDRTRMDGLPLAIELAAARLACGRLRSCWRGLIAAGGTGAAAADRWSTRSTGAPAIAAQCDRLELPAARTKRAATVSAAQRVRRRLYARRSRAVAVAVTLAPAAPAVSDLLQSLLDNSLVQRRPDGAIAGPQRYGMLETLREFATGTARCKP